MSELLENPISAVARPLIEQINQCHRQCIEHDSHVRDAVIQQANYMREAGLFLLELKQQQKHGRWLSLFATSEGRANPTPVLDFDAQTGRRYMSVASNHPGKFTDANEALHAIRVATHRDTQQTVGALPWVGKFTKATGGFIELLANWQEKEPVESWDPDKARAADLQLDAVERQVRDFRERVRARL